MMTLISLERKPGIVRRFYNKVRIFFNCVRTSFFTNEVMDENPIAMIAEDYEDEYDTEIPVILIPPINRLMTFFYLTKFYCAEYRRKFLKQRMQ